MWSTTLWTWLKNLIKLTPSPYFSPLFVCVASSFYTHICQSICQTQKRTKPSYTSGWHYSLFNVAAAYCNSTFPLCHLLRESCLLDVQCQCLHLFIIVLVRLNWSFLFFMSAPMCSPSWLMLMINICNGSLHSPDTAALILENKPYW